MYPGLQHGVGQASKALCSRPPRSVLALIRYRVTEAATQAAEEDQVFERVATLPDYEPHPTEPLPPPHAARPHAQKGTNGLSSVTIPWEPVANGALGKQNGERRNQNTPYFFSSAKGAVKTPQGAGSETRATLDAVTNAQHRSGSRMHQMGMKVANRGDVRGELANARRMPSVELQNGTINNGVNGANTAVMHRQSHLGLVSRPNGKVVMEVRVEL